MRPNRSQRPAGPADQVDQRVWAADVVTVRLRGRGRGSGVEIDGRFYDVYTLRDGKIVRMDQFTERSEALGARARWRAP